MSLAALLMLAAAGIVLALGTLHLVYTFSGPAFLPRDPALRAAMQATSPRITADTTMWRCWIGFNASHSLGAMLFGLVWGWLALQQPALLFGSLYLRGLGLALLSAFLVLAYRYWFRIPLAGIALALACYAAALVLAAVG